MGINGRLHILNPLAKFDETTCTSLQL